MTENALVKRQSMPADNIGDIGKIGTWLAKSGMFGCTNPEQGVVLALTCHSTGMNPLELKEQYHLIDGNLTKRADAMLASLRDLGGEYEIITRTPEKAEIKINSKKAKGSFTLTMEEAKLEPFPYKKDGKTFKKNWATPRARMQMLWARVVSDGVRTCCPEACKGAYAPEELQDMREQPESDAWRSDEGVIVETPDGKKVEVPVEQVEDTPKATVKPKEKASRSKPKPKAETVKPTAKPKVVPDESFDTMPLGKAKGSKFADMTIAQLAVIKNCDRVKYPSITEGHIEYVTKLIKEKENAG